MQDEAQFEQLMMQYRQLKNGAEDIAGLIEREHYDDAITMLQAREQIFLSCKSMRRYLELTPEQQKELDTLLDEIRAIEIRNITRLEEGMEIIQAELKKSQQTQKFQNAYDNNDETGNIVNIQE